MEDHNDYRCYLRQGAPPFNYQQKYQSSESEQKNVVSKRTLKGQAPKCQNAAGSVIDEGSHLIT